MAPAPGRPRRAARRPLAARRPQGRPRRHRRQAAGAARTVDRTGLHGERRGVIEGIVLGDEQALSPSLRAAIQSLGPLPPARGLRPERGARSRGRARAGLADRPAPLGGPSRPRSERSAGYVLAVGPQPSVVRAGVAGALGSAAWLTARASDRWYFLLLAALALLAWNPYDLLDAGFQLSFAAVAAIFLVVPRLLRRARGLPAAPGSSPPRSSLSRLRAASSRPRFSGCSSTRSRSSPSPRTRSRSWRSRHCSTSPSRRRSSAPSSRRAADGARLGQRLVRRIPRRLRALLRRAARRAGPLRPRRARPRVRRRRGRLCLAPVAELARST